MKPSRYSSRRLGACDSSSGSYRSLPSFAGEMAERLKAHAWKACLLERVTWVRIPLSPPVFQWLNSPLSQETLLSVSRVAGKDYHPIGWNHDIRRSLEAMQRTARCENPSPIARNHGIDPVVIKVTIENFEPRSKIWESYCVVVPGCLGQRCNHNNVVSCAFKPAMKCNHAVPVVYVECVHIVAT